MNDRTVHNGTIVAALQLVTVVGKECNYNYYNSRLISVDSLIS